MLSRAGSWGNVKPPVGAQIDWSDPINNRLLACYLCNENGGMRLDDIARGNVGVFTNFSSPSTATSGWVPGKFGPSLRFDGSNDLVQLPSTLALKIVAPLSYVCWFYPTVNTGVQRLMSIISADETNYLILGYRGDLAGDPLSWQRGGNDTIVNTTATPTLGAWNFGCGNFAATPPDNVMDVWLRNGTGWDFATSTSPNLEIYTQGQIGAGFSVQWFNGRMDAIRFYGRVLLPHEIKRLYAEPFAGILAPRRRIICQALVGSSANCGIRTGGRM